MNDLIREFVEDFKRRGWKSPVYSRFFHFVDNRRDLLPELVRANYPNCSRCGVTMRFLMQLDSDLPIDYGGGRKAGWLWGSGGIGYIFWCDACRVSGCHWQCT